MGSSIHDNDYAKICSSCNRYIYICTTTFIVNTYAFNVDFPQLRDGWAVTLYRRCSYYNIQHPHIQAKNIYNNRSNEFRWRFIIRPAFSTTSSLYKQKPSRKHIRHIHKHNIKGKTLSFIFLILEIASTLLLIKIDAHFIPVLYIHTDHIHKTLSQKNCFQTNKTAKRFILYIYMRKQKNKNYTTIVFYT